MTDFDKWAGSGVTKKADIEKGESYETIRYSLRT